MKKLIISLLIGFSLITSIPKVHAKTYTFKSLEEAERFIEWIEHEETKITMSIILADYIYGRVIYWQKRKGIK